ncbi:S49 family peptidase [Pontivivens ytuae]|uniref:S49 family peptidase n=1 Tax=Pontivivens ytuae TaxID=2789856 RepID=A0A7S9LPN7_9RHOB|nr:S49 family peptidase [Pontivivens ytuae]QPH52440.1 S49 family peptidase [Pontivivens ytuae]
MDISRLLPGRSRKPVVAVIRLHGVIAASGGLGRSALSDSATAPLIERAFATKGLAAVALSINSPGGSPAQSALIAARIRRLAEEKEVPVYAFCEDVAASGGYWLATAGDEIFADANSILGSIGVISASFGFHELLSRYGVERRVHTAGEDKSMLDPFRPEREEDVVRLKALQSDIHENFKEQVTSRRGAKLADKDLFTGEIWVGRRAQEVGLIDGIGHLVPKMKEIFGDKVRFRVAAPRRPLLARLGAPGVGDIAAALEERALWARWGL